MYSIVEFGTAGDGSPDDRPLGKNGRFLEGPYDPLTDVAHFETKQLAASGATSAYGLRDDGQLGLVKVLS